MRPKSISINEDDRFAIHRIPVTTLPSMLNTAMVLFALASVKPVPVCGIQKQTTYFSRYYCNRFNAVLGLGSNSSIGALILTNSKLFIGYHALILLQGLAIRAIVAIFQVLNSRIGYQFKGTRSIFWEFVEQTAQLYTKFSSMLFKGITTCYKKTEQ